MTTWRRGLIGCALAGGLALCLILTAWVTVLNVPAARGALGPLAVNSITVCFLTSSSPPMRFGLSWDACPFCSSLVVNPAQWRQACLTLPWPWPFGVIRGSLTP